MEFLVIVLFVAAIFVANLLVSRALRRRKQAQGESSPRKAAPAASRTSVEAAREANARLDAAAHQQVYAAIAQGQPIKAVKLYEVSVCTFPAYKGTGVEARAEREKEIKRREFNEWREKQRRRLKHGT